MTPVRPPRRDKHGDMSHFLGLVYQKYHDPQYLGSDPLVTVRRFADFEDREIAALFSALLAYGNVKQINASLDRLFTCMDNRPAKFIREFRWSSGCRALAGFKHRFSDEQDILCLCLMLHKALAKQPLQVGFARGIMAGEKDLANAAGRFMDYLQSFSTSPHLDRLAMLSRGSFKHLMPRADKGSACKRVHLFLRWMIREDDGIDLGLWRNIDPALLLVPVDTHIMRLSQYLGFTERQTASLEFSRDVTSCLRRIDPADPVRFDFSLCRLGILRISAEEDPYQHLHPCQAYGFCKTVSSGKKTGKAQGLTSGQ